MLSQVRRPEAHSRFISTFPDFIYFSVPVQKMIPVPHFGKIIVIGEEEKWLLLWDQRWSPLEWASADWIALTELGSKLGFFLDIFKISSACAPRCSTLHIFSSLPPSFRYVAATHILAPILSTCEK